jgi:predicted transposase YbfD/YdcC
VRVTSTRRTADGTKSVAVLFYVTSLGPEDATGTEIADIVRARWGIENRLHWLRDVVFDEDRHTTRLENTTRLWTLLRSVAISLIHLAGLPVTETTQAIYRRPERAFALVR